MKKKSKEIYETEREREVRNRRNTVEETEWRGKSSVERRGIGGRG